MEQFLVDLVRIPSVNGQNAESGVARRIADEASRLGLPFRLSTAIKERPNVVVSVGKGPTKFLFVAHTDTVPVGDASRWSVPPFGGVVKDGRLISRGACDNKAGIAVALYTLSRLEKVWPKDYEGCVALAAVVDEESGASSEYGLKHLLEEGLAKGGECKGSIYTYHGRNVTIGHRGVMRFWIEVFGCPVHAGSTDWALRRKGANAVMALVNILHKIESEPWPSHQVPHFPPLTITPGTLLSGGEGEGIVPEKARALVDVRLPPHCDDAVILARIEQIIDEVICRCNEGSVSQLSSNIQMKSRIPAYAIPRNHPLALACVHEIERVTGVSPEVRGCGPANEGYMLGECGIPCIPGMGPIGGNAHAIDEYVELSSLSETVDIYAGVVARVLGLSLNTLDG